MTLPPRLPLVATLCVLVTGLLLVLTRPAGPAADAATVRVVRTAAGSFAVGARWSRTADDAVLYYAEPDGRPAVGLTGAVVADAGYCAGLPTSQRGFAGFADVVPGDDVDAATLAAADSWGFAIAGRDPPAPTEVTLRLSDATPATRVSLRVRAPASGDPCLSRRVDLDVIGFAVDGGVATFVLVRDVDPDGVSSLEAQAIVQSLRRRT